MSCVFQNIDPPSPSPPGECVLSAFGAGGGQSIFWKTQDTALFSTYIESSLQCLIHEKSGGFSRIFLQKLIVELFAGHQNQNQKIHHVVKIKQENVELKAEVTALRDQLLKWVVFHC
jgi:hypothetical protein